MPATETPPEFKLKWNVRKGAEWWTRADGARWCEATGRKGIYELVVKDGLHAAYFCPRGNRAQCVVLLAPQSSSIGKSYQVCVDHNKDGLDL
jgi:hypothetical protein